MKLRRRKPIGKHAIRYIEKLYAMYARRLFFTAKDYVKDKNMAEDVVHMVFANILTYPNGIMSVPEDEVVYFLTALIRHESYHVLEDQKKNDHESLTYENGQEGDFVEDPNDNYLQMIDLYTLKEKLSKLPSRQKDALLFRYVYGFKCKEIADMFHISERSVKVRCAEARKKLKNLLEKDN